MIALAKEHHIMKEVVFRLARKYIAGYTMSSALQQARLNSSRGLRTTVTFLNNGVGDQVKARYNANTYVQFTKQASRLHLNSDISVRLSQLGLRLNNGILDKCVDDITSAADGTQTRVWFEAENGMQMQELFDVYRHCKQRSGSIGMEIPIWYPLEVGTVSRCLRKGDSVKLTSYAYTDKAAGDVAGGKILASKGRERKAKPLNTKDMLQFYISDIGKLLQAGVRVAVLDHDEGLITKLAGFSREYRRDLIFELPLGYSKGGLAKLMKMKINLGVYTPYGSDWTPYIINKLTASHGKIRGIAERILDAHESAKSVANEE